MQIKTTATKKALSWCLFCCFIGTLSKISAVQLLLFSFPLSVVFLMSPPAPGGFLTPLEPRKLMQFSCCTLAL